MPRRTFKEKVEQNPVTAMTIVAATAVTSTFGVMTYFHQSQDKLRALESEKKISYLEGRLASIERKVGTEERKYFDVSVLLVPPEAIRGLGKEFTFFTDLNCYVAVPKTEQWSHEVTNELGLANMLVGEKVDLTKDNPLLEILTSQKLHLWKGPGGYDVNTGNEDIPILHIFPFVIIESLENAQVASMIGKAVTAQSELDDTRRKELDQSISRLSETLKSSSDDQKKNQPNEGSSNGPVAAPKISEPSTNTHSDDHAAEKLETTEMLERIFRSDFAGFMLFSQLASLQQFQQISKQCTVDLVSAEKKGNVLYCNFNITIVDSKTKLPIYWDREFFFVSGTKRSYVVATSAPSTDRRSPSSAWITTWLSSLRVPLE